MTARASDKLSDLTGVGLEWLIDKDENVRLEFYNGNIIRNNPQGNLEDTVT